MKLLIAPLHYVADKYEGSEYTRAYDYLEYLSRQKDINGDVLVGYCSEKKMGNLKIISMFKRKPTYISNIIRLQFVVWIFIKWLLLKLRNNYDVIWHNGPFSLNETFSLVAILNKSTPFIIGPIVTPHQYVSEDESRSMGKKIFKRNLLQIVLKKIDHLTYPLSKVFRYLSYLTLRKSKLVLVKETDCLKLINKYDFRNIIVHNMGLNLKEFGFNHAKYINANVVNIITVSYLVKRKGVTDLVDIMNYLIKSRKRTNYRLKIVGSGPEFDNIKRKIKELNLSKYIKLVGFVTKKLIHKYYENSDLFVTTTLSDSMPAMYFEAMASGLLVISYDNPSVRELKLKGAKIVTSEVGNISNYAKCIMDNTKDSNKLMALGKANYKLSKEEFSFEKKMEMFTSYLEKLKK